MSNDQAHHCANDESVRSNGRAFEDKLAVTMKCYFALLLMVFALLYPSSLRADPVSFTGKFSTDDVVLLEQFNVGVAGIVTIRTFGYAGGTNGMGTKIAAGGFDPNLTLFDSAGNYLSSENDGMCGTVGKDAVTGNCFDSFLAVALGKGSYTVALTESDNLAIGPSLSDSFTQVGSGNFSCPEFLGTPGAFCDASPAQRNGSYALDISTPNAAITPEPATWLLVLSGLGCCFMMRKSLGNGRLA